MIKSIFILLTIFIITQAVYIRKQTIKNDEILGQVVLIEEIQETGNAENLTELLENNADLLEKEFDYATELANLLLNTIEGELVEDSLISNEGQVFNAFEGMKGFVNSIQKAEHEYFEDLKNQKEEKDKEIVKESVTKEAFKEFDYIQQVKDENKENTKNDEITTQKISTNKEKVEETQQNELKNFSQKKEQEVNKVQNESNAKINEEQVKEANQYSNAVIVNTENNENTQNTEQNANFNVNSKVQPSKISVKLPNINMGIGPQISVKVVDRTQPLYKDPSVIIGVFTLMIFVGAIFYYFIKSWKNLRKSSSSILESNGEIFLSNTGGQRTSYEKVKVI